MHTRRLLTLLVLLSASSVLAAPPAVTDTRLVLELVAREPDIVTPTGLAVDERGRVWVIENNTHQRESKYKGPASDRIRILDDLDATGRARRVRTFADGFKDAMSIAFGPDGSLYLATRSTIFLLRRKGDTLLERKILLRLQTAGTYPHNGLCGFAFDPTGTMYFGMGENLGVDYKLIGADGTTLSGGGEGGNMFRCRPDGTKLERIATGFWNPFHHTVDAFGRLFVVDNDPDSRGPCRLLHVVEGGDYGYRFRYGRKGNHPFQCWAGELPGTLGMVAGTGEAPSGVLAYESTGLPADYRGDLLVTSWGDHTIERYRLIAQGASFTARMQTIVRGGEDFRPVAIATGPDGAVYFSDWVDKSYPVHGKGRVWRLRSKKPIPKKAVNDKLGTRRKLHALWTATRRGKDAADVIAASFKAPQPEVRAEAVRFLPADRAEQALKDPSPAVCLQAILRLRSASALKQAIPLLADTDPFLRSAAVHVLGRPGNSALLLPYIEANDASLRLGVLLALRRGGEEKARTSLRQFLTDDDPEVRRSAIQWVGEERLREFAGLLESAAMKKPTSAELFRSLLAARHLLGGGKPGADPADEKLLARVLHDAGQPAAFRILALQILRSDHPAVAAGRIGKLLKEKDATLRHQVVRSLALRGGSSVEEPLLVLAKEEADPALRAEAVMGLGSLSSSVSVRRFLLSLLERPELRRDALRSLRAAKDADVARSLMAWWDKAVVSAEERQELAGQLLLALKTSKVPDVDKRLTSLGKIAGPRPTTDAGWHRLLAKGGDPAAGERIFFHPSGPGCYRCHRVDGNGSTVGPDLSNIAQALSRERLIDSILRPGKEIAPRYVSWRIVTQDGKVRIGVISDEGPHSTVMLVDAEGKQHVIKRQDIEERAALPTSIMPDNLHEQMTTGEFLDVIAYLTERLRAKRGG